MKATTQDVGAGTIDMLKKYKLSSKGSPDKTYLVETDGTLWQCSCAARVFHPEEECKHIKQVKQTYDSKQ